MDYSAYESINKKEKVPINTFVASLNVSSVHWHSEYELIGVLCGKLIVRVGTDEYVLEKGDLIWINPNEMHSLRCADDNECLCMVLQLDESLIGSEEGEIRFYMNSASGEEIDCGYKYMYGLLSYIVYEGISHSKGNEIRLKSLIYELLADMFEYVVYDRHYRDYETIDYKKLVVASIDYLNMNLENPKVLDDVCRNFGVSRKTLDRNYNLILGTSAKGILADLRIERAKQLLKNTDKNMNFIKDNCGFGSEKTFYRVFKEATGMTPMDFRIVGVMNNQMDSLNGYLDYNHIRAQELLRATVKTYGEEYLNVLQKRMEKI